MGMIFHAATKQIIITRGDSGSRQISYRVDGEIYDMAPGDRIQFGVKKDYTDATCLINKTFTQNPFLLSFVPADTKSLDFGDYVCDMQFVASNGYTDTFMKGTFSVTEEVVD